MKDLLINFRNSLTKFNPDFPIYITNNKGTLEFRQMGIINVLSDIRVTYLVPKGFKWGLLTQVGFNKLMDSLTRIAQDDRLGTAKMLIVPQKLGFSAFVSLAEFSDPQPIYEFKLVNITNPILRWFLVRNADVTIRILHKSLRNAKLK